MCVERKREERASRRGEVVRSAVWPELRHVNPRQVTCSEINTRVDAHSLKMTSLNSLTLALSLSLTRCDWLSWLRETHTGMSKPRMLSSQPKRSWGDSHISDDEPENTRPDFTLNSDEWPPTPPKKRPVTVAGAKGKQVAGARQSSVGGGLGGARTAMGGQAQAQAQAQGRPLTSTSVQKPAFVKESPGGSKVPLAPLFRRAPFASTSSSSSSSSRPGPSTYAYNNPTTGSVLPKKRTLPWEELEASSSRSTSSSSSRNFHELAGPPGSKNATGGAGRLLMSESMDIKQKVVLSPEQQTVHKLVVEDGKNVFFTGSAGASLRSPFLLTSSSS